jgi:hypothetical protein
MKRAFSKKHEKAQVSAELIIVLAALVAVAILLIAQLQDTAKSGAKVVNSETDKALKEIGQTSNYSPK